MSRFLVPDPKLQDKLCALEREYIAKVDDQLAPLLADYRDFVGTEPPEDIKTRNLDAILRIHHASLAGASGEALYATFAGLVWPLHDELEQRATVVELASAATKEQLQRATERVLSLRKERIADGRALLGDEKLNEVSDAVQAMVKFAQAELKKSTDRQRLLQRITSAVRRIRWARFVWRVVEVMAIVGGGLTVEKINEWIKEQVFEFAGVHATGHSTWVAIAGAATWFVAVAFVIWFHDEVVNEWMKHKIDRQRRDELVYDMIDYLSHRMSLEYQLGLLEHQVGAAAQVKAGPGALGSSETLDPSRDRVP